MTREKEKKVINRNFASLSVSLCLSLSLSVSLSLSLSLSLSFLSLSFICCMHGFTHGRANARKTHTVPFLDIYACAIKEERKPELQSYYHTKWQRECDGTINGQSRFSGRRPAAFLGPKRPAPDVPGFIIGAKILYSFNPAHSASAALTYSRTPQQRI